MDKNVDKKGVAGVSIVEIMISLVLVAFALIAVTSIFPNMMRHRKGIHEAEQAKIIAMEALEVLQYYPCAQASESLGEFQDKYAVPVDMGSAAYTVRIKNKSCGSGGADVINTVEVSVGWTKSGKPHTITVTGALK